ncbi:DUF1822 family protein [Oculatella sp. FACHB-28]|nr:DUF1822 family protein [Cyanobacteria bacterium FACHB-471]MBD2059431.1 DUF1822 family protein [Oculatella sp. FACHB-28]
MKLIFSVRTDPQPSEPTVKRAKLFDVEFQLGRQPAVLLMAITPETEQKVGVLVQLHPANGETYLPTNFQLSLLTETGEILQTVQSRSQDNYIQLKRFRGLVGERFNLQLRLGSTSIKESFTI